MYEFKAYSNTTFQDTLTDNKKPMKKKNTLRDILASKAMKQFIMKRKSENVTNRKPINDYFSMRQQRPHYHLDEKKSPVLSRNYKDIVDKIPYRFTSE